MKLAFYKVSNSQGYMRHTFDVMDKDEILKNLNKLPMDEVKIYNLENKRDVLYFVEDYNDELLDGGWWCVEIF